MPNRLANETSPYLLQHAHNPVDWYPWSPEALQRAKAEDLPILLSVGYSACHWCHVMERESFEDEATAAIMNEHFVNVKVDREERPDLDEIYMLSVQAFTGGHGGWPMTVFLTPDGKPFFGGSYFPPEPSRGMPSFHQVMERAVDLYRNNRSQVDELTEQVVNAIESGGRLPSPAETLSDSWLDAVAAAAREDFDAINGGFGTAPKFPPQGALLVLLAHWRQTGNRESLDMVTVTLDAMAQGGMYDLLGGGFARYSVDERWLIPHFEKMLYDNAQLVAIYADAFAATGKPQYEQVVRETLDYVLREMTAPQGGFYSAQDADSEGVEGKFFVWARTELEEVLGADVGGRAAELLGVSEAGSFEHGTSVLRLQKPRENLTPEEQAFLRDARPRLLEARGKRTAPGRDDKIITAWNGLMISGFARAGRRLDAPAYLAAASRAADFILEKLLIDGRLRRLYKDGAPKLLGYLDDHIFFAQALLDLYEATFEERWLVRSAELVDRTLELFADEDDGGLFFTGDDAERLVARGKSPLGGATPSANGTAALLFARLDALLGREDLGARSDRLLRAYQAYLERAPRAIGVEALASAWRTGVCREIGIVGEAEPAAPLLREVGRRYLPFSVTARVDPGEGTRRVPWMDGRQQLGDRPTAYLCTNRTCRQPTDDAVAWAALLDEASRPTRADAEATARVHAPELPSDPDAWLNTKAPLSLSDLRGQVVVLDFWTYCCINCMHVLPELAALEEEMADLPVEVIGVHSSKFDAERVRENVERAIDRHGVRHPVILDPKHEVWEQYAVRGWPTVVVIDPTGRIAWRKSGEVTREQLSRVVRRLLPDQPAQPRRDRPQSKPEASEALRFPGKLLVWPSVLGQMTGADPFGEEGRLYVADSGNHRVVEAQLSLGDDGWPRLRRLRTIGDGAAGLVDGSIESARFRGPQGLDRLGDTLWVADTENHALRAVDLANGQVRTVAGNGKCGRGGGVDPARPRATSLRSPWDVEAIGTGVLIAMAGTHQIWVYVTDEDKIGPFIGGGEEGHADGAARTAALAQPSGLSVFGPFVLWVDSESSSVRMASLQNQTVGTVVGRDLFDFGDVDGTGEDVRLQHPLGIGAGVDGAVYVADTYNHKVKVLSLEQSSSKTFVGGDGTFKEPSDVAVAGGFLLVADTGNHRICAVHRESGDVRALALD